MGYPLIFTYYLELRGTRRMSALAGDLGEACGLFARLTAILAVFLGLATTSRVRAPIWRIAHTRSPISDRQALHGADSYVTSQIGERRQEYISSKQQCADCDYVANRFHHREPPLANELRR
jgi:hypothetical protein